MDCGLIVYSGRICALVYDGFLWRQEGLLKIEILRFASAMQGFFGSIHINGVFRISLLYINKRL